MSTRSKTAIRYEDRQGGAELHDGVADAHPIAGATHEKQDIQGEQEASSRTPEHSQNGHERTPQTDDSKGYDTGNFGHEDVAVLAHELREARGCPEGSPDEDWFHAAETFRTRQVGHQK